PSFVGDAVVDQVVDDPPFAVQHHVVLRPTDTHLRDVVGHRALEEVLGAKAGDVDLAQVGEVEDPDGLAHRFVLRERARVLDRHVPPGERAHLRAERSMSRVERRAAQRLPGFLAHGLLPSGGSMASAPPAEPYRNDERTEGVPEKPSYAAIVIGW